MQNVCPLVLQGWPDSKSQIDASVLPYWSFQEDLHGADGVVFKGTKIVIPQSLRKQMLHKIHEGHQGKARCKARARDCLFWPGMQAQIDNMVEKCEICQTYKKQDQKEPMIPQPVPERPWERVGVDLFYFQGNEYLLVLDYFSKYVEIALLGKQTSSGNVITHLKSIFARHGIPVSVVSDNGPQFASMEFKRFSKDWDFMHVTSSPEYAQGNGLAERSVQTIKTMLKKAAASKQDLYKCLLIYR